MEMLDTEDVVTFDIRGADCLDLLEKSVEEKRKTQ